MPQAQPSSNPYLAQVAEAAQAAGIDPVWAQSILLTENAPGDPSAVSSQGAQGLMQVLPSNAQGADLGNATQNIDRGVQMLAQLSKRYNGDKTLATAAYFGGPDQTQWGPKTHNYNRTVANNYNAIAEGKIVAPQTLTPDLDNFVNQATAAQPAATPPETRSLTPDFDQFVAQTSAANAPPADPYQIGPLSPTDAAAHPIANAVVNASNAIVDNPVSAGIMRGAHVVLDAPAEALASGADKIGLTALLNKFGLNVPTGAQTAAADQADQSAFRQQFAGDPIAQAANLSTQAAMVLPALESGAGAVRSAGNALVPAMGDFITGNATGGLATRGASLAAGGALSGAGAAGATAAGGDTPIGNQLLAGAEGGAVSGPAMGAAGAVGNKLLGGVGIDPYVAQLAQKAINLGIPLRAGQIAANPFVRLADDVVSRVPGSGAAGQTEAIQNGFNRALSTEMGAPAEKITPDVMAANKARLGQIFNRVAQNSQIKADPQLASDLSNTYAQAKQVVTPAELSPIESQISNITNALGDNGIITGAQYQALTAKGAPLDRAMQSNDPNVRFYAGQIRDTLDAALQRSAPPEMQQALAQARYQYKVMKTIQPLAEKSITGDISPTLLMNVVRQNFGNIAYDGGGNMGDLARIGQLIKPPPNSGTAERMAILGGMGAGGVDAVAGALHNPMQAITGGAMAAGVPLVARAANLALNNKASRNYLIDRALGKIRGPSVNAITAAAAQPAGSALTTGTQGQ